MPRPAAHAADRSRIWRKFVRNPAAIAGALILLVVIGAAIFAPWWRRTSPRARA